MLNVHSCIQLTSTSCALVSISIFILTLLYTCVIKLFILIIFLPVLAAFSPPAPLVFLLLSRSNSPTSSPFLSSFASPKLPDTPPATPIPPSLPPLPTLTFCCTSPKLGNSSFENSICPPAPLIPIPIPPAPI
ncbi:hypothetical protein AX774_g2562, partial [Zancudomyces culisetae]